MGADTWYRMNGMRYVVIDVRQCNEWDEIECSVMRLTKLNAMAELSDKLPSSRPEN